MSGGGAPGAPGPRPRGPGLQTEVGPASEDRGRRLGKGPLGRPSPESGTYVLANTYVGADVPEFQQQKKTGRERKRGCAWCQARMCLRRQEKARMYLTPEFSGTYGPGGARVHKLARRSHRRWSEQWLGQVPNFARPITEAL